MVTYRVRLDMPRKLILFDRAGHDARTESGTEVEAAVLKSPYIAADIEQSQLSGYLDAGNFPSRKSSSAITACRVTSCLFLPLVRGVWTLQTLEAPVYMSVASRRSTS